jgi:hypothetical protein
MLPEGDGALVVRTDFSNQRAWDELCELIRKHVPEGLLADVRVVDDRDYDGVTVRELLGLVPDDAGYAYMAVADELTSASTERPQDRNLLIIDLDDDEPGGAFRAIASELASIDANLSLANMDFSDYAEAVDEDGVYRGFDGPA